jgi:[histone H3]-trimethyl-L-lysine4 demethylase
VVLGSTHFSPHTIHIAHAPRAFNPIERLVFVASCRYGIPSTSASDFEECFKSCKPELFQHQPDVLFHLVTMLSPRILKANNVPVHSCLQNAGEFVITFPNAYHGGFNHGVNSAEAVNFVPSDWLRFGAASMLRYRAFRKPSVLCHEQLLLDVVREGSGVTAFWATRELERAVNEEAQLRYNLWASVRCSLLLWCACADVQTVL